MRKKEREITEIAEIEAIISSADVCHIAFADGNMPYIVAMSFGYCGGDNKRFYFHCALEGKKIELMKKNNYVCFEIDTGHSIITGNQACDYTMKYSSVVGYGHLQIARDSVEKISGLNYIMNHYGGTEKHSFRPAALEKTLVLRLDIIEMAAKRS